MLRCLILARLTASARIARAPMATAPAALAPTAKAPRLVHPSPVATRANATCLPNGGCSSCLALGFLTVPSFPRFLQRLKYPPRYDATKRNAASPRIFAQELALRRWGASIHRAAEKKCSRRPPRLSGHDKGP